jgi:hypothetical protein
MYIYQQFHEMNLKWNWEPFQNCLPFYILCIYTIDTSCMYINYSSQKMNPSQKDVKEMYSAINVPKSECREVILAC